MLIFGHVLYMCVEVTQFPVMGSLPRNGLSLSYFLDGNDGTGEGERYGS